MISSFPKENTVLTFVTASMITFPAFLKASLELFTPLNPAIYLFLSFIPINLIGAVANTIRDNAQLEVKAITKPLINEVAFYILMPIIVEVKF